MGVQPGIRIRPHPRRNRRVPFHLHEHRVPGSRLQAVQQQPLLLPPPKPLRPLQAPEIQRRRAQSHPGRPHPLRRQPTGSGNRSGVEVHLGVQF
ncbi:unnamed protein product [Linum tenue]|uniref:Uncharacterized protein n=1 Tax=Linum tenue TaxID=586396 RepID=A0AAV0HZT2_9ROSI|nr:unnamed protein product [Linum tenue]